MTPEPQEVFEYDVLALDRISSALSGIPPAQIDMHYWRRTPVGLPFPKTIACAGGWVCLMRVFDEYGLQLIATSPESEFAFVPAIRIEKQTIRGYAALGYIVQATKDLRTAERYGRTIFSFPGCSPFDQGIKDVVNSKVLVNRRIALAKALQSSSQQMPA